MTPSYLILTPLLLFGQLTDYPDHVNIHGKVFHDSGGLIYGVEDCLIDIRGFNKSIKVMTDSIGNFNIDLNIPTEYYQYNLKIAFHFSKQLQAFRFLTAERRVSPKLLTTNSYDLGHIYLSDPEIDQSKKQPTVWDMLEDSLMLMHRKARGLNSELDKLNIRLSTIFLQNEQYQKHIEDLELQSDNYYDQLIELRAQNEQVDLEYAKLQSELNKQNLSRSLFDNIFVEHYMALITVRDSVLKLLDSSFSDQENYLNIYYDQRKVVNKYLHRQDLFAENSGIKEDDYNMYLDVSGLRDSLIMKQDRLVLIYFESDETTAYYNTLTEGRNLTLTIQDSLILSNLIYFQRYELHEVVPGEDLWNIAKIHPIYRNPYAWRILYLYNKDQLANPDSIYPGQVLKIPIPE